MAKINITVSGTTYDGDLDLAGDSGFQSLIKELQGLKSTLSARAKSTGASLNVAKTQKALDDLSVSAGKASQSLDDLGKSVGAAQSGLSNLNQSASSLGGGLNNLNSSVNNAGSSLSQMSSMMTGTGGSLAQMSSMVGNANSSLAQMSSMSGGAGSSLAQMSGMLGKGTKGIAGMASKANLYIAAASLVIDGLAQTVTALSSFTNFLFTGGTRLSDFTEALHKSVSELPIVGGALGLFTGVLATVTRTLDSYIESLETTSASGASFNNNLMLMRGAAFQTGQTLEQFASTVSANTDKFAQFGTVTEGALKFAKVSNQVRGDLRNLGYSVQEVNDTLPTVMSLFSQGAQGSSLTTDQMANSAKSLMTEMDAMAKLTGKSRKEQADAQAKTMQEAAMRMKMAGMTEDQQKALNEAMIQARAKFGESGAEMVKLRILGIAPQTEAQRNFQAVMGGAMKSVTDYTDGVVNGTGVIKDDTERKKKLDEATMKSQVGVMKTAKQYGTNLAVAQAGGVNTFTGSMEAIQIASQRKLKADGTIDEAQLKLDNEKAREEQKKQDEAKKAMTDFQETMMKMKQAMFDNVILPLFEHFKPALTGFAEWAKGGVQSLIQAFKDPTSYINTVLLPSLKWVGSFLLDNWKPILITVGLMLAPIAVAAGIVGYALLALGTSLARTATQLGVIIYAVIAYFKILYDTIIIGFKTLGNVFNAAKNFDIKGIFESFQEGMFRFLAAVTDWIPGMGNFSKKLKESADSIAKERDEREKKKEEDEKNRTTQYQKSTTETRIAGEVYKPGQPLSEKQINAIKLGKSMGNTYSPDVEAQFEKQKSASKSEGTPSAQPAAAPASGTVAKPLSMSAEKQKNADLLTAELKKKGFNQGQIAAVLGNVAKESGFTTQTENLNYGNTSNERIRSIFGSRAAGKTDAELADIKKDPQKMGEMMYGSGTKVGQGMGNTEPGDGFKYRGRGFIQLTGKNNYAAANKAIFGDNRLVDNPDLASDPAVAAQISAWFTEKQGKGMAKKMGVDLASASQEDLNRVYTSAIAGREIKKGEGGYLGGEVMGKVNAYAQQFGGTAVPAATAGAPAAPSSGTVAATVTPTATTSATPATAPAAAQVQTAQTSTPAASAGDSGILSALRELVDLQYKANRLLTTISANV